MDISSSHENHHLCKYVGDILLFFFLKYCIADHSILVYNIFKSSNKKLLQPPRFSPWKNT